MARRILQFGKLSPASIIETDCSLSWLRNSRARQPNCFGMLPVVIERKEKEIRRRISPARFLNVLSVGAVKENFIALILWSIVFFLRIDLFNFMVCISFFTLQVFPCLRLMLFCCMWVKPDRSLTLIFVLSLHIKPPAILNFAVERAFMSVFCRDIPQNADIISVEMFFQGVLLYSK